MSSLLSLLPDDVEVITHANQADWLEYRQGASVGASEVADVLNVDGCYMGSFALAHRKLGMDFEPRSQDDLDFGHAFEPGIISWFEKKSGVKVERLPPYTTFRNKAYPWLFATPDALYELVGDDKLPTIVCPLEAKFIRPTFIDEWDAEPPLIYFCQLQAQMLCLGVENGAIAGAFIGDFKRQMRFQFCERHIALCDAIVSQTKAFCEMVKRGELPAPDGHDMATAALKKAHPRAVEYEAPVWLDDGPKLLEHFETLQADVKIVTEEFDAVKNLIRSRIGGSEIAKFDGGQFSWKWQGGNPADYVKVPATEAAKLTLAKIPFETVTTNESRVLRAKRSK